MDKQKKEALIKLKAGDRDGAVKAVLPKVKGKAVPISTADKLQTIRYGDKNTAKKAIKNM